MAGTHRNRKKESKAVGEQEKTNREAAKQGACEAERLGRVALGKLRNSRIEKQKGREASKQETGKQGSREAGNDKQGRSEAGSL